MNRKFPALAILLMFALAQLLGLAFQFTMFEIEKIDNPEFSKQTSVTLSPYRGTEKPLVITPVAFVVVLYFYLFMFKFSFAMRILKLLIYGISILCFAIITQVLGAYFLTPFMQLINFILSIISPIVFLLAKKFKVAVDNILGVSICAIMGSSVASYFTLQNILVLLAIISVFDYYFVIRTKQIPTILEGVGKYEIPMTIKYAVTTEPRVEYQLGFGDLIFATGVTIASFIDKSAMAAIVTTLTTTIFLALFLFYIEKEGEKKPYPAMPAIFIGAVVGSLINLLA